MTIYVPKLRELPSDQMALLDPTAKFSVHQAAGRLAAYVYDWPNLRVVVNVMPDTERLGHLEQFVGWLEGGTRSLGKTLSAKLATRVRSTTIVLGFVVEKTTDQVAADRPGPHFVFSEFKGFSAAPASELCR